MKDLIKASSTGVMYEGKLIFPRILCTVADQPQERLFFGLKAAGSYKDCSCCTAESSTPKRRAVASSACTTERQSDEYHFDTNDDIQESALDESEINNQSDAFAVLRERQLAGHRNGSRSVLTQLIANCLWLVLVKERTGGDHRSSNGN